MVGMKRLFLASFMLLCTFVVYAQSSICGVVFGSDYDFSKTQLENKFGDSYFADENDIIYKGKEYAGFYFSTILFGFQRTLNESYFNKCIFVIECSSVQEAKTTRDYLKNKFEKKYGELDTYKDTKGFLYYQGGESPLNSDYYGFCIDVFKYDRGVYAARITYGPYNYVNEEF